MKGRADKLDLKFTTIAFRWQKTRLFHLPFFQTIAGELGFGR